MIYKVADILKAQIADLEFVDRLAGLVRPLPLVIPTDAGVIVKNIPVEVSVSSFPCTQEQLPALVPDEKYTSLIFFEDQGTATWKEDDSFYYYPSSSIRICCWFNLPKINADYIDATYPVMRILESIPTNIANTDELLMIHTSFAGFVPNTQDVFSGYDFDMKDHQYHLYPYDVRGINFTVNYAVSRSCLGELSLNPKVC